MSRTKNLAELCALVVDDIYGELSSRIFALLLRRGRLPIPTLVQYSKLPARSLRHGLALLVRQGLVYFHYDGSTSLTYYEANQDAAYCLLRSGKVIGLVQERYGLVAKEIAQDILLLGHAKVGDLANAYESKKAATKNIATGKTDGKHLTNGIRKTNDPEVTKTFDEVLAQLLEAGLVEPVVESMFRSPSDTYNIIEKEILKSRYGGSTKGVKQKDELKVLVSERLRHIRSEGRGWVHGKGVKRRANGEHINGGEKRRKLANGAGSSNGSCDEVQLDRNLVVRMNFEKCTVALRTQQLMALAAHDIGEVTSKVYYELLGLLEDKISRCRSDPTMDGPDDDGYASTVTTMELSQAMSTSINVALGIGKAPQDRIDTSGLDRASLKSKRTHDEAEAESGASSDEDGDDGNGSDVNENGDIMEVDHDSDTMGEDPFDDAAPAVRSIRPAKVTFSDKLPKPISSEDRQNRMTHIKKHLQLLAEHSRHLLRRCGNNGLGEWTVDFEGTIEYMRETQLDNIIEQDFGNTGQRLARILRQKGKLDEKTLPSLALLKQKDVRTKLAQMHMSGFVDTQEIPRDNSRAPTRTIFLWFFDTDRVTMLVLDSIYKTMARCMQRLEVEKLKEHDILALADRSDVRAQEEAMLEAPQLKRLREIREKEEKILGQISRLDELVGIFRDF
ncbi:MAG: RNA polymerase III subunit C82 [Claussenomyces sp. TS43310]|nr:MAG: RNA polymerase III subunit C82 [Claussenomyces sp. TS43310]